jgi:hypothetical protein
MKDVQTKFNAGLSLQNSITIEKVNCFNFWVYPQRLVYIGRRFGTLYRVHLQRLEKLLFVVV